jgi:spore germination protein Q
MEMITSPYQMGMPMPYTYPTQPTYQMPTSGAGAGMGPGMFPQTMQPGMPVPSGGAGAPAGAPGTTTGLEESYIENILRLNLGKVATIYMTFENNSQWNAKIFRGRVEAAGRDHIIISDPTTGMRYVLLMVNLDYITFEEELNYYYPFSGGVGAVSGGGPTGGR